MAIQDYTSDILIPNEKFKTLKADANCRSFLMARKKEFTLRLNPLDGVTLSFYFEDFFTVFWQIQEMLLLEGDSQAKKNEEWEVYKPLFPILTETEVHMPCTVMIEIEDKLKRAEILKKWVGISQSLYLESMGKLYPPIILNDNAEHDKTFSVHFLKWIIPREILFLFRAEGAVLKTISFVDPMCAELSPEFCCAITEFAINEMKLIEEKNERAKQAVG